MDPGRDKLKIYCRIAAWIEKKNINTSRCFISVLLHVPMQWHLPVSINNTYTPRFRIGISSVLAKSHSQFAIQSFEIQDILFSNSYFQKNGICADILI